MKIALCISGFAREYQKTFPSLQKHLLHCHDVDVFIHTWSKPDRHLPSSGFDFSLYNARLCAIENPKTFTVSPDFQQKNIHNLRDINGIYSMFYGIQQANQLRIDFEQQKNLTYDVVIRSRFDLLLEENLHITNTNSISIPKHGDFFGINDQLAFGTPELINKYSSCFDHLGDHIQNICQTDPELLLQTHLLNQGLKIQRFSLQYKLLAHGQVLDNETREKLWLQEVRKPNENLSR